MVAYLLVIRVRTVKPEKRTVVAAAVRPDPFTSDPAPRRRLLSGPPPASACRPGALRPGDAKACSIHHVAVRYPSGRREHLEDRGISHWGGSTPDGVPSVALHTVMTTFP